MPTCRFYIYVILSLPLVNAAGCASSQGYSTESTLEVPITVQSPSSIPSDLMQYMPRFVGILEARGFAVGRTQDPRAMELMLQFDSNPWNFEVTVSLWREGLPILTASAVNKGNGTALNPSGALKSRVNAVALTFDTELEKLLAHTEIVPDANESFGGSRSGASESQGTCFLAGPDGAVITSHHVIDGANNITVKLSDGRELPASVEKSSAANDLAVLRIAAATPEYLSLGSTRSAQLGDHVFTIGFPSKSLLGSDAKFTEGSISALSGIQGDSSYMQISVPVQPGNSGGPIVSQDGSVIGVVAATAAIEAFYGATGALPQNVNWAVKSDYVQPLLAEYPSQSAAKNRSEAIARTQAAVCEVTAAP